MPPPGTVSEAPHALRRGSQRSAAPLPCLSADAFRTVGSLGAVLVSSADRQAVCSRLRSWAAAGHSFEQRLDERCYLTGARAMAALSTHCWLPCLVGDALPVQRGPQSRTKHQPALGYSVSSVHPVPVTGLT